MRKSYMTSKRLIQLITYYSLKKSFFLPFIPSHNMDSQTFVTSTSWTIFKLFIKDIRIFNCLIISLSINTFFGAGWKERAWCGAFILFWNIRMNNYFLTISKKLFNLILYCIHNKFFGVKLNCLRLLELRLNYFT